MLDCRFPNHDSGPAKSRRSAHLKGLPLGDRRTHPPPRFRRRRRAETPDFAARLIDLPIEDELKESYLTYAMSVIVSRALPDVRDGLKPSQRRILVAMNDLNLTPGCRPSQMREDLRRHERQLPSARRKCHLPDAGPHGPGVEHAPRAGRQAGQLRFDRRLPPAAMRYTEARMSPIAALMLEDLKLDTVDFVPTYDERHDRTDRPAVASSPICWSTAPAASRSAWRPASRPTTWAKSASGGRADRQSGHLDRRTDGDHPGPGLPHRRHHLRPQRHPPRLPDRPQHDRRSGQGPASKSTGKRNRIVVTEIPYQQARDRVEERIAALVNDGRIAGISGIRNESDLKEPVRLVLDLKRDADPDIVLNQLYKFSPLQDSFSLIFLALVDGKPRILSLKEMLEEFLRHRVTVIRRRTQFLLSKARSRKHTVEGLLLAHANIDEVIRVIRASKTQAEAKAAADADQNARRAGATGPGRRWVRHLPGRDGVWPKRTRSRRSKPTPSCG